jgi:SAM-dependent methyltransferase
MVLVTVARVEFAPMTDREGKFERYYEAVAQTPPRPTLLKALALIKAEGRSAGIAADLGCGNGIDTIALLSRGWQVVAIDKEPDAIQRLRRRSDLPQDARLDLRCQRMEESDWGRVDLVNASFALPLVEPQRFPDLWRRIRETLNPGGRFAGQLYGPNDEWAGHTGMTIHSRAEIEALIRGFAVEELDEIERDGTTAKGRAKHWHYFNLVLRLG